MAQSITTTIFITLFATDPVDSAILNQVLPTIPSPSELQQNPSITGVIFVTTIFPPSSIQSVTIPTHTSHSDTRSRLTSTSSTGTSNETTPPPLPSTTPLSPNNTVITDTTSSGNGDPESSHPKPTLVLGHDKKHTIIIVIILGVTGILILAVLCIALYLWHRRRKKVRQTRADQEKAQAYSYSYNTTPTQIPHSQEPAPASSSSLQPVGTLMPRKIFLALQLAPGSGPESGFAMSTHPRQSHAPRNHAERQWGAELTGFNEPPPEYGR